MLFLFRLLLAWTLVHLLDGIRLGDWLRLLRRERFRINVLYWPRAVWITCLSIGNSLGARLVERRFGAAIEATRVVAPVFILGHYRSGTTLLHELMVVDPRFASPNRFQTFNPWTFLATESWLSPLVEPFMLPRRVQEDEVAPMALCQLSPYLDWCFPNSRHGYGQTLTFRAAPPEETAAWSRAFLWFLKSLTLRLGRPLLLKSPPHTARVGLLLALFPDARFIHIRRDPFAVFVSTVRLLKDLRPVFGLQWTSKPVDIDAVIATYASMYDAYFADLALVPPGQIVEIAYEDLERDPVGQLRGVYEDLALGDFESIRPALEGYLAAIAGYQKNRHPRLDDATRAKVATAWGRFFDAWGYPR